MRVKIFYSTYQYWTTHSNNPTTLNYTQLAYIMLTGTRRKQVLQFTAAVYVLTFVSILTSYNASHTFLHMTLKLTSGANMLILVTFVLLNIALSWHFATYLLFGELRLIEQEHIFERVPFSVLGIVVMTSMFSEYHLVTLLSLSAGLIGFKIYHWILRDRLDQRMQVANQQTHLHNLIFSAYTRNVLLFALIDFAISHHIWTTYLFPDDNDDNGIMQTVTIGYGMAQFETQIKGSYDSHMSMILLFGMEFCSLFLGLLNLITHTVLQFTEFYLNDRQMQRYTARTRLHLSDSEGSDDDEDFITDGLEGKYIYEKIIDLLTQVAKTALHVLLLLRLQLVLIKDIIWDIVALYKGTTELYKIFKNNSQLDDKLPNIDVYDLVEHDNVCIVCMDDLVHIPSNKCVSVDDKEAIAKGKTPLEQSDIDSIKRTKKPKKLPCGHMLHLQCIKNWMERSQTCPICRLAVFDDKGNVKPSIASERNKRRRAREADISAVLTPTATVPEVSVPENWYGFRVAAHGATAQETLPLVVETLGGNTSSIPVSLHTRATPRDPSGAIVVPASHIVAEVPSEDQTSVEHKHSPTSTE